MLCDRCKKRDAKILYTEIINGLKKEQHLCEECATDYTSFQMEKPLMSSEMTLGDLLSTLLENYAMADQKKAGAAYPSVTCSNCGTTFEEFIQKGRFGCAQCYRSFNGQLGKTLKGIQGAEVHTGKRPKGFVPKNAPRVSMDIPESERLSILLQEAIEKEEFEEAARLRDLIKEMKKEETKNA
ncbi:UvrB/UvrC motif-containing protein [Lachnospiraceae bacterium MD1]|jgi:protein arginine kinase activator|uniref:UvrB/UvrC motif-containing protein n=1 Tax=Variimorphobacter saccharofermentans TaxID=2755051 RepID=A0A839K444_9FIRM|nr:UvrB/UvrC motif-containing protein [Variimorphobacter saccharofermentans]MBB2184148.1 UvrB/UvrC motif-containing protein [Variimorphobacter saccharofermentans]